MDNAEGAEPPAPVCGQPDRNRTFFADSPLSDIRIRKINFATYFDQTRTLGTSDLFYTPVK